MLDQNPVISAKMNCDKHVCKIILEAAQMLSLAHIANGITHANIDNQVIELWNAKTQTNNHVSRWVRETNSNYNWTSEHGLALCSEYQARYKKVHKCTSMMQWLCDNVPPIPVAGMTPFRQAVANDCYHDDPVIAYHLYYARYKSYFAKWRLGNVPDWYIKLTKKELSHDDMVEETARDIE